MEKEMTQEANLSFENFRKIVLEDYRLANESREASLIGRREVLTGKAKFGIFGDGKELAQIAMAKHFKDGDFRSGYYRDQTFMLAIGQLTLEEFFAQLYAHTDVNADPSSAGRQMNGHYATRSIDENGEWKDLTKMKNSAADISCTAGQMPRLLGLAQASKYYRNNPLPEEFNRFSIKGNEVAFGTIGDASTSEGYFFETLNAAGVMQVPLLMSVWDDGHGISVPKKYQTTKESISEILIGLQRNEKQNGFEIFKTKGWDYVNLCETYEKAVAICREEHVPVLIHVEEVGQPQGHSTSGSHERYKSVERLQWEKDFDCIKKFKDWILEYELEVDGENFKISTEEELNQIEKEAKTKARQAKASAWKAFIDEINTEINEAKNLVEKLAEVSSNKAFIQSAVAEINSAVDPMRRELYGMVKKVLRITKNENLSERNDLLTWIKKQDKLNYTRYNSFLHSESKYAALKVEAVAPKYSEESKIVDAREILRDNFDVILGERPEVMIFGEDAGRIGDVNQGLEGLQAKYGENRVFDTGIREASIMGQGIGMSMRGLRPIAEIQYLDYFLYGLQVLSDDLASLHYRTFGGQKAPFIIRTRGHRLEGIWHSGSPMGVLINALRGMHLCVPRNMTQAAGFYNTLLQADEPGVVIEPLNGYRLKEKMPENLGEFKTPLGQIEVLQEGSDLTLVTYGSCVRIAQDAMKILEENGISVELIDIQTLLPFDLNHDIKKSLQKTNRLVILDEDVNGGASAYILQKVLETQDAYFNLDSKPITITAKDHRPAYGSDGDYFSKPNQEEVFEKIYQLMRESEPNKFPDIF
jgi:2-oxoisovalerate dehydrogenase E1 component